MAVAVVVGVATAVAAVAVAVARKSASGKFQNGPQMRPESDPKLVPKGPQEASGGASGWPLGAKADF